MELRAENGKQTDIDNLLIDAGIIKTYGATRPLSLTNREIVEGADILAYATSRPAEGKKLAYYRFNQSDSHIVVPMIKAFYEARIAASRQRRIEANREIAAQLALKRSLEGGDKPSLDSRMSSLEAKFNAMLDRVLDIDARLDVVLKDLFPQLAKKNNGNDDGHQATRQ